MIEYPIQQREQVYLGPNLNRSCINISAVDDSEQETIREEITLFLQAGEKSNARVINSVFHIVILDDDSEYWNMIQLF